MVKKVNPTKLATIEVSGPTIAVRTHPVLHRFLIPTLKELGFRWQGGRWEAAPENHQAAQDIFCGLEGIPGDWVALWEWAVPLLERRGFSWTGWVFTQARFEGGEIAPAIRRTQ